MTCFEWRRRTHQNCSRHLFTRFGYNSWQSWCMFALCTRICGKEMKWMCIKYNQNGWMVLRQKHRINLAWLRTEMRIIMEKWIICTCTCILRRLTRNIWCYDCSKMNFGSLHKINRSSFLMDRSITFSSRALQHCKFPEFRTGTGSRVHFFGNILKQIWYRRVQPSALVAL